MASESSDPDENRCRWHLRPPHSCLCKDPSHLTAASFHAWEASGAFESLGRPPREDFRGGQVIPPDGATVPTLDIGDSGGFGDVGLPEPSSRRRSLKTQDPCGKLLGGPRRTPPRSRPRTASAHASPAWPRRGARLRWRAHTEGVSRSSVAPRVHVATATDFVRPPASHSPEMWPVSSRIETVTMPRQLRKHTARQTLDTLQLCALAQVLGCASMATLRQLKAEEQAARLEPYRPRAPMSTHPGRNAHSRVWRPLSPPRPHLLETLFRKLLIDAKSEHCHNRPPQPSPPKLLAMTMLPCGPQCAPPSEHDLSLTMPRTCRRVLQGRQRTSLYISALWGTLATVSKRSMPGR